MIASQVHGFTNGHQVGHLSLTARSAASRHDDHGGDQQTRGNCGCEHEPPSTSMVFSPQIK
jgi:hypothetical protein